ncbi:MAG: hypothetical protein HC798_02975 [Polaribacter sp.]|nr:hypothetical protein [Polaribacter sp.]
MKLKKTYRYAFWSALYINVLAIALIFTAKYFFDDHLETSAIIAAFIVLFVISFLITQYRAEHFIYRRLEKLYDNLSFLDKKNFKKEANTDIDKISESMQAFAEGKLLEIQNLNERDSFRRDFLGNVAHELKTPLFTVQGYILTLLDGAIDDKQIRLKYLERANQGVERLVAVVNDLDMIAKLETQGLKLKKEVFDILELVQNVFNLFEMKAKKRNITLRFDKIYEFQFCKKRFKPI